MVKLHNSKIINIFYIFHVYVTVVTFHYIFHPIALDFGNAVYFIKALIKVVLP